MKPETDMPTKQSKKKLRKRHKAIEPSAGTLLTQREVENRVKVSYTSIWQWIKKGTFPKPLKPGGLKGRKYYRLADIENWEQGKPWSV